MLAAEQTSLSSSQVMRLDELLQSNNPPMKCPNHPNQKTLDADERGVHCTRCDHKWSVEKIPTHVLSQIENV
jgi:hypothetical protein